MVFVEGIGVGLGVFSGWRRVRLGLVNLLCDEASGFRQSLVSV